MNLSVIRIYSSILSYYIKIWLNINELEWNFTRNCYKHMENICGFSRRLNPVSITFNTVEIVCCGKVRSERSDSERPSEAVSPPAMRQYSKRSLMNHAGLTPVSVSVS